MPHSQKRRVSESLILVPSTGSVQGLSVHYLFSVTQVSEVLTPVEPTVVPFAPGHLVGLANWRKQPTALVCPDRLFGLGDLPEDVKTARILAVSQPKVPSMDEHWHHVLLYMASGGRMLSKVPEAKPENAEDHFGPEAANHIKGLYSWSNGLILVPDIERIIQG